jgi:peptidoglycan/xylan/chitin deacetylase (PgdA/CDA1 family)
MSNVCKIITYHYVRPIKNSNFSEINGIELFDFEKQIKFFKSKFTFITYNDLIQSINFGKQLPENSILLTFDDGLKEHYDYVFPILKKYDVKGLFFPTAKPIVEKIVLNVHKIHFILAACQNKQIIKNKIFSYIEENQTKFNLKSAEKYYEEIAIPNRFDSKEIIFIKRILQKELPEVARNEIINFLFKKYVDKNESKFSELLYLSIDNIKEMENEGMYFGSHGYSHNWLSKMSNEELVEEIRNSKNFLKQISFNNDDPIMCYPHGDYNENVVSELKKNGFVAGFTIDVGDARLDKNHAFFISRYDTNDFPITQNISTNNVNENI